jgi:drug/metabolite transporter (DMT)-like permease
VTAPSRAARGIACVLGAAVLWALIGLFTPALLELGMSAVEIAFWRALGGGLCFALHGAFVGALRPRSVRDAVELAVFGLVAVAVFYVALARAVELGGVSLAWILLYTAPGWVAVAAITVLREHVDRVRAALVVATIAGVALVAVGGGEGVIVTSGSVLWGLLSGLSYASWYVGGKRFLPRYGPITISFWTLLVGAVALLPVAGVRMYPLRSWLLMLGLAVVATYLPVLLYYTGLRTVDASRAAIVATVEPVAALAIGATVGTERLSPVAAVGALTVLGAAALAATRPASSESSKGSRQRRRSRSDRHPERC